jgi:hypothetical protein
LLLSLFYPFRRSESPTKSIQEMLEKDLPIHIGMSLYALLKRSSSPQDRELALLAERKDSIYPE